MNRKLSALSVLLLGSLAGCASAPSRTDSAFGESVRQARAVQIINPEAAARAGDPSVGIDARVSRSAVDLYQESFKSPQRTFDILGIGGVNGAQ